MGNRLSCGSITYGMKTTASKRPSNDYHASDDTVCAICMDDSFDVESDNKATTLICGHRFHTECIQPWMRHKGTCPFCRRPDNTTFPRTVAEIRRVYSEDAIHAQIVREMQRIILSNNHGFQNEEIRLAESIDMERYLTDLTDAIHRIMLSYPTTANTSTVNERWEQLEPLL